MAAWFQKKDKPLKASERRDLPGDVFEKCKSCGEILYREKLAQNLDVFGFELPDAEMASLGALDRPNPDMFDADSFGH